MVFLDIDILLEVNFCKMEKNLQKIYRNFGLLMFVQRYYGDGCLNKITVRMVDCSYSSIKKKLISMLKSFNGTKFNKWYDPEGTIFREDVYGNTIDSLESAYHFHLKKWDIRLVVQYGVNNINDNEEEEDC